MSASSLQQAIQLVKAGRHAEARELLEPLLQADPHDVAAWMWYIETWPALPDKLRALGVCARHNPDHPLVARALAGLRAQQPAPSPALRSRPARQRGMGMWPAIIGLAVLASALLVVWALRLPQPNRNVLAIGAAAGLASLDIPLQPPAELDFKSRAEVLALRREAVGRYPGLMVGDYRPSDAVFGQLVDHLPWWGIAGQFYYGPGQQSIEGPAEESRFILNPYLLVAAEFYTWWDREAIPEDRIRRPDFQLYCPPGSLRWQPRAAYAEVAYDARCVAQIGRGAFDLIAYNARDMNLNFMAVSYPDSRNISKPDAPAIAYAIPHFLHQGGSCGYPGGCNNMSPATPEIDGLQITGLPAQTVVWLWRAEPASLEQPPDMTFVIHFR